MRVVLAGLASSVSHEDDADALVAGAADWTGPMTFVSSAAVAPLLAVGKGRMRCSVVGCSSIAGDTAVGTAGDGSRAGAAADLLASCALSASLKMPVSQSGSSPTVLLAPGIGTWDAAGNCAEAGGTAGLPGATGPILLMLRAMVAASWTDDCWGYAICCC